MTTELYQQIKQNIIAKQHPIVRPHIKEYFNWLKSLDALDVYDSIEKGETVKDAYTRTRNYPLRMSVAAARGLLKASKSLREKAEKAINVDVARLTLRFENPKVYEVIKRFDPQEEHLQKNLQSAKEILGVIPKEEKVAA